MDKSLVQKFTDTLNRIDTPAIKAYEQNMPLFIDTVRQNLLKREDLAQLIGTNADHLLEYNLAYHPKTLLPQLQIKSAHTLLESLIWMYRMCINRGLDSTYLPIEMEVWKRALHNTLHRQHAETITLIYQLIIDSHAEILALSQASPEEIQLDNALVSYFKRYLIAILEPDMRTAMNIARDYIQTVYDIPVWWERVILPTMYEIGRLWAEGTITVGQEHIATSITQRVMSVYYPMILELPRNKGTIVVTVSQDELHEIGARMLSDILEIEGWDVYYTGANTPLDGLLELIAEQQAQFLCISTTLTTHLTYVQSMIACVRAANLPIPTHIVVGGQAYLSDPNLWQTIGADGFVASASKAADYLQTHVSGNGNTSLN